MSTVTIKTFQQAELSSEENELEQFVKTIPSDVIKTAAALAHEDNKEGRCIPQSQIKDYIKQEMGWN